jgi:diguanylate cyclase
VKRPAAPPAATAQAALRLEPALALLAQSKLPAPPGEPGSAEWLQALIDGLCALSSRDGLTGLANRRHFESVLARELDRVARAGEPALLLVLDIDHFKQINDSRGHAAGDLVIKAVAQALARVGGEEFAIALPNCPPAFGPMVAERVRARIERCAVDVGSGAPVRCTVSLGGAFAPQWVRSNLQLWMERADKQLYRAKHAGRNCAQFEPAVVSQVSAEEKGLLFAPLPGTSTDRES